MLKYGKNTVFNPARLDPLNIDRQSADLVPKRAKVLEIGCATGFIGEFLIKKKNCYVVGVELGKDEAKEARKRLSKVIEGDIEDPKVLRLIDNNGFDIVFASAIIEHLKDPWNALRNWNKFLKREGFLIITTSNIAHWSVRLKLLKGGFDYQEYGILDNTHLRFFTTKTFRKLAKDCGYKIEHSSIDPVGGGVPRISKILSRFWPNLFAYQMLIKAKPVMRMNSNKNVWMFRYQ